MRISDWSSDVCSSDLERHLEPAREGQRQGRHRDAQQLERYVLTASVPAARRDRSGTKARKQGAGRRLAWTPPARTPTAGSTSGGGERKSVVAGKRGAGRVDGGGGRVIRRKKVYQDDKAEKDEN